MAATYPNVPKVPGVPAVFRSPIFTQVESVLATAEALLLLFGSKTPVWGIFDRQTGRSVVTADNVVGFDYRNQNAVSDYPVENGGFQSYDKVANPFAIRLRFSAGGTTTTRQALINSIEAITNNLVLYDAVTPEKVYQNINVIGNDYRRTATNGVGLLEIDVYCVEIRQTATQAFTQTKSPAAADPVDGGQVQTKPPTQQQSALRSFFK